MWAGVAPSRSPPRSRDAECSIGPSNSLGSAILIKGFRQIVILTTLSRVLGMLRDVAFAYFLGASGLMDGWAIAFKIPNLARRLFGEGAAASSLIPVYSEELHRDPGRAHTLALSVVTAIFVLLSAITVLGEGFIWLYYHFLATHDGTRLKLALTSVMLPYMVLICVVAVLAAILNAHRHFAAPAAAPAVLNVSIIAALCIGGWILKMPQRSHIFIIAVAVLVAGLAQLALQLPPLWSRGIHIRPAWDVRSEPFRRVLLLMGPMVLGLTATQINTLVNDFVALWLSGSAEKGPSFTLLGRAIDYPLWEGAVSHLFYAQRLYQFPLGVFGASLATAVFPVMSADAARRDFAGLCRTVSRGLRCAVFVAMPATVGLLLISQPIVAAILQRGRFTRADTSETAVTLCFYALGLTGYFAQQVLTRAFYSLQESSVPAKSAVLAVLINLVLNLTLVWFLGTGGLAAATAICSYVQVAVLAAVLRRRFGSAILAGLGGAIRDTILATLCLTAAVVAVRHLLDGRSAALVLVAAVLTGAATYVAAARLLHIEMLSLLWARRDGAREPVGDGSL
jgi:putative peptidoglycan lipid II flippase